MMSSNAKETNFNQVDLLFFTDDTKLVVFLYSTTHSYLVTNIKWKSFCIQMLFEQISFRSYD